MRLIDADAAVEKLREYVTEMENDIYYGSNLGIPEDCIREAIEEIPTVEAEPVRHGRWITNEMTIDSGCTGCSYCRSEYYIGDLQALEGDNDFVMFCPNCGAKMDGGISDATIHDNK